MSLYQHQRKQVGQLILDTSIEMFREKGYEETTIDEITKTVGIAKGTFYNFFHSKRDILMKWAAQVFQKLDIQQARICNRTFMENMEVMINLLVSEIITEETLFITFLKELATIQGNMEENRQFDFSIIIGIIAESSSDYDKIGNTKKNLKINILSDALYMAIIRWINMGKPMEELKVYLKDIMDICLNGIISREESM